MRRIAITLAFLAAIFSSASAGEQLLVDRVDMISVLHLPPRPWHPYSAEVFHFWSVVQGEWSEIDSRWGLKGAASRADGKWVLSFHDPVDACERIIIADQWVETWGGESPELEDLARPWHVKKSPVGLAQPKTK